MFYRCANDFSLYCKGEPDWSEPPILIKRDEKDPGSFCGSKCTLEPGSCGRSHTHTDKHTTEPMLEPKGVVFTLEEKLKKDEEPKKRQCRNK